MLKGIPQIISPSLMKILMEMGHGDELVIGDGNFPGTSMGRNLINCEGHNVPELLDAIMQFFPLDTFVESPVSLMKVVGNDDLEVPIWGTYKNVIQKYDVHFESFEFLERNTFYDRAKKAYAIVTTSELSLYACVIIKKGVITN